MCVCACVGMGVGVIPYDSFFFPFFFPLQLFLLQESRVFKAPSPPPKDLRWDKEKNEYSSGSLSSARDSS